MIFCAVKDTMPTRITILIAIAVVYAVYHLVRWYMARPKVEKEDLPAAVEPKPEAEAAEEPEEGEKPPEEGEKPPEEQRVEAPSEPLAPRRPDESANAEVAAEDAEGGRLFGPDAIQRMIALGKSAWSAGDLVEANFWLTIARANGVHGIGARLVTILQDWHRMGCPDQMDHVHAGYPPEYAEIAQAYMLFRARINQEENALFILSRMEAGSRTARTLALYERMVDPKYFENTPLRDRGAV